MFRGPVGTSGANGTDGTPGTQIRKGDGIPDPLLGNDGDFYVNNIDGGWYGPKTGGDWGTVIP